MKDFNYYLPLKEELPSLKYDIATYCHCLSSIVKDYFPPYLDHLKERIETYASLRSNLKPKNIDPSLRIYIFDHRLNIPLVLLDNTGKIADFCYQASRYRRTYDEYYYGDGESFGPCIPGDEWDKNFLLSFIDEYGFTPMEELAMPSLVIFKGYEIDERRPLSTWQVNLLLMKYRTKNLVDWKELIANY